MRLKNSRFNTVLVRQVLKKVTRKDYIKAGGFDLPFFRTVLLQEGYIFRDSLPGFLIQIHREFLRSGYIVNELAPAASNIQNSGSCRDVF